MDAGRYLNILYIHLSFKAGRKRTILVPEACPCFDEPLYFENPYNSSADVKKRNWGEGVVEEDDDNEVNGVFISSIEE